MPRWILLLAGMVLVVSVATIVFLPHNIETIVPIVSSILSGQTPKSAIIIRTISLMPADYPFLPVVGLGPGQFSSRAGLMSTGYYFGGINNPLRISYFPNQSTPAQEKYLLDLWRWDASNPLWGSSQKPYFSWLTLYSEWGGVGVAAGFVLLGLLFWSIRRNSSHSFLLGMVVATAIMFFILLGIQENNWEIPQAWFSGLLGIKVMYAELKGREIIR
jgi:hypothetical protein